ncbi:RNase adapter RapZ [Verticiella sediminum]|uniref:RNase adapter RapZ n=1 Tax=Verticiella sediminum TaxID=1247510 RepID=A0A556A6K8_9BURK|nr:RNase adapter RapZ [Verticiella sediminum]TSH88530.1 RNase adapter RapZ [Verticiella sediminum]
MLRAVLITGISGSGKSVALRMLEDAGYTCVDNLPVRFLHEFVANAHTDGLSRVAVAVDARSPGAIADIPRIVLALKRLGVQLRVVFLDANTTTIVQRYSETRRRHPLTERLDTEGRPASLHDCILAERQLLGPLREQEHVIDTSGLTAGQLRQWVRDLVDAEPHPLVLTFESFAYKSGVPLGADLVFDARCLPNPFYDPVLRPLTGRDEAVANWLAKSPLVHEFLADIEGFVARWLPRYAQDTRAYLTVAIGCTGGQHRSVYLVERLAEAFGKHRGAVLIRHRAQVGAAFLRAVEA